MERLSLQSFGEALVNRSPLAVCRVEVPGFPLALPLKVMAAPDRLARDCAIVFHFHGAIDRHRRTPPVFDGAFLAQPLSGRAWVVSVADPLMEVHPGLATSWYAGSESLDVPAQLRILVAHLLQASGACRTIFAGGSTGGFAALRQASWVPGSLAVVGNPIVSIDRFRPRHVASYRETCWPSLGAEPGWPAGFLSDMAAHYGGGFSNQVVYACNARDPHLWTQAVHFLRGMGRQPSPARCLFLSAFHPDHSGHKLPRSVLLTWIRAAVAASAFDLETIGTLATRSEAAPGPSGTPATTAAPSPQDMALAAQILASIRT